MVRERKCRVLVIGGGPGGYIAALRAGQLGLDTVLVTDEKPGGTCLNRGCIPSKALIHAATRHAELAAHVGGRMGLSLPQPPVIDLPALREWKEGVVAQLNRGVETLLARAGVEVVRGHATLTGPRSCEVADAAWEGNAAREGDGESAAPLHLTADDVILATGSEPVELPSLPFGGPVLSSTEALALRDLPRRLVVVGAGYIGLELGTAFRKLGSEVTFIEALDRILPLFDVELSRPVNRWLRTHRVKVHTGARAQGVAAGVAADVAADVAAGVAASDDGAVVTFTDKRGREQQIAADRVLVTVGRHPRTAGWGLAQTGVALERGAVKVDDMCRTSVPGVWAIGDLTGEPMLAHRASAQGERVAERIAGGDPASLPTAIPAVCFTAPEIVAVGLAPDAGRGAGHDVVVGKFPLAASGRALAMEAGRDGGFVRVVARADDHRLLGVHAVGAHVAELAGEFAMALERGLRLEEIGEIVHAHPTLTEGFAEAALMALERGLHA